MATFNIDKLAEKVGSDVEQLSRAITIALFNGVVRQTRVDTGRLRGNWQTTVGRPATGTVENTDQVPLGADGGQAQEQVTRNVQPMSKNIITNNLPYAGVWNKRDAIVAGEIARLERTIREQIRELKR